MAETSETSGQPQATAIEFSEFGSLLQKEFRPQTDRAKTEVENAVKTLAEQALRGTNLVSSDVAETIKKMIAEIDKKFKELCLAL